MVIGSSSVSVIEPDLLAERLQDPAVRVLDGSWHLPTVERDAQAEYEQAHIPGAVFFDIDHIADADTDLPHMLPEAEAFARAAGAMGIDNQTHVVVYDSYGLISAARVWWMFRVFGHERVSILNGGLPRWIKEDRPLEENVVFPSPRSFKAVFHPDRVRSMEQVQRRSQDGLEQILDTRPSGRFNGTAPEPRPGLPSGHMPGALNLDYTRLLDPTGKTLLPLEQIIVRLIESGVSKDRPVICSCGSGISACILTLALHLTGWEDVAVYDGSWTEWASRNREIVTGKDEHQS